MSSTESMVLNGASVLSVVPFEFVKNSFLTRKLMIERIMRYSMTILMLTLNILFFIIRNFTPICNLRKDLLKKAFISLKDQKSEK